MATGWIAAVLNGLRLERGTSCVTGSVFKSNKLRSLNIVESLPLKGANTRGADRSCSPSRVALEA